jgi:excisionase family DNA binding protein
VDDDTHSGLAVQEPPGSFLTPKDLQRELQIGEKLCYRLLRSGAIPSVRVGGLYRIYRPHLEEALLDNPDLCSRPRKSPAYFCRGSGARNDGRNDTAK